MNPSLQGYAAAVLAALEPGSQPAVAADLAAVERAFDTTPVLHTTLTDTALPAAARRAVFADLLAGRVSGPAARVAAFAVGTVAAGDVHHALVWLRHRAEVPPGPAPEPMLSFAASRQRVGGYAAAIFEDSDVAAIEEVEDELFRLARTVEATPSLRTALANRDLTLTARLGIVDDLLAAKVHPATLALVRYTVVGGRPRDVVGTLDWLVDQAAAARGWRVAHVRAARSVDGEQQAQLAQSLTALAGAPVEVQVTVDADLLSGAVVQVGDLLVDATVKHRLDLLREHMTAVGWDNSFSTTAADHREEAD